MYIRPSRHSSYTGQLIPSRYKSTVEVVFQDKTGHGITFLRLLTYLVTQMLHDQNGSIPHEKCRGITRQAVGELLVVRTNSTKTLSARILFKHQTSRISS